MAVFIGALLLFVLRATQGAPLNTLEVGSCTTAGCTQAADFILQMVNLSADPCQDFYQFMCGTFIANSNPINTWMRLQDDLISGEVVKTTMKILSQSEAQASAAEVKAISYFKSCNAAANDFANDDASTAFLKEYLGKELRGFSYTKSEDWSSKTWVLEAALAGDLLENGTALFQVSVELDSRNSSRYGIVFDPETTPIFGHKQNVDALSEDPTYLEEVKDAYVKYLKNLAQKLMDPGDFDNIRERYLRDVVDFELSLAKITPAPDENSPIIANDDVDRANYTETDENKFSVDVAELEQLSPAINWTFFLLELGKFYKVSALKSVKSLKISYRGASYFHSLSHVIKSTMNSLGQQLAKRVFHNYFTLKAVLNYVDSLSCGYSVPYENMRSKALGKNAVAKEEVCWQSGAKQLNCYAETTKVFPLVLAREFVRTYFNEANANYLRNIAEQLRKEYVSTIDDVDWMDDDTKSQAVVKVRNMLFNFGHPPDLFDCAYDSAYDTLVVESSFLANIENVNHFKKSSEIKQLDGAVDRVQKFWQNSDTTDQNAFYSPLTNSFGFMAGDAVFPLLRLDFPQAYNWGRAASIMGHEITHGFDNNGRNFDESGQYVNWWSNDSSSNYEKRVDCLRQQFNRFTSEIANYGDQILGEAIADNGGIKVGYQVFKQRFGDRYLKRVDLPGLPFTNEQIFFISAGQNFCFNWDSVGRALLLADEHPLPPFRVNGMMMNSEAWANAFNCRVGSPMNPAHQERCAVW